MEDLIHLSIADVVVIFVYVSILIGIACWAGFAKNKR